MRSTTHSKQLNAARDAGTKLGSTRGRTAFKAGLLALTLAGLSACQTTGTTTAAEGIGYRAARAEQISVMREYRACVEEAVSLDGQARRNASAAQYMASALLIENCEKNLGPVANDGTQDERMRAYALGTFNALKGGDAAKATQMLQQFETAFDGRDLYFQDGTSFTESMGSLLGREGTEIVGQPSTRNVSRALKDEVRRIDHWSKS